MRKAHDRVHLRAAGLSGIGFVLAAGTPSGGASPIGTLTVTINDGKTTLPICPGFGRCAATSGSLAVSAAIDTGELVSVLVYQPAAGSFPANNTTGASNGLAVTLPGSTAITYCTDLLNADGNINLSAFTTSLGGTISGTFSGTVVECFPAQGGGITVTLDNGSFSCGANQ